MYLLSGESAWVRHCQPQPASAVSAPNTASPATNTTRYRWRRCGACGISGATGSGTSGWSGPVGAGIRGGAPRERSVSIEVVDRDVRERPAVTGVPGLAQRHGPETARPGGPSVEVL